MAWRRWGLRGLGLFELEGSTPGYSWLDPAGVPRGIGVVSFGRGGVSYVEVPKAFENRGSSPAASALPRAPAAVPGGFRASARCPRLSLAASALPRGARGCPWRLPRFRAAPAAVPGGFRASARRPRLSPIPKGWQGFRSTGGITSGFLPDRGGSLSLLRFRDHGRRRGHRAEARKPPPPPAVIAEPWSNLSSCLRTARPHGNLCHAPRSMLHVPNPTSAPTASSRPCRKPGA